MNLDEAVATLYRQLDAANPDGMTAFVARAPLRLVLENLAGFRSENQVLREVMPCTYCNDIGVVPEEAFGRDEDGAPMVDGVQPCPEGCELPGWLIAERNDARDDAAELDRLREQLAEEI